MSGLTIDKGIKFGIVWFLEISNSWQMKHTFSFTRYFSKPKVVVCAVDVDIITGRQKFWINIDHKLCLHKVVHVIVATVIITHFTIHLQLGTRLACLFTLGRRRPFLLELGGVEGLNVCLTFLQCCCCQ